MLTDLDREIMEVQDHLNPDSKSYRYDSVRLDMLTLKRDVAELQNVLAAALAEAESYKSRLHSQETKTAILEAIFRLLCKPEMHESLVIRVASEMCEKWAEEDKKFQ